MLELDHDEKKDDNEKELLKVVDYNEFVLPFVCNTGKFLVNINLVTSANAFRL